MSSLHLSRVAYGCSGLDQLVSRIGERTEGSVIRLTTRYCPKRVAELEGGSLYWIIRHQLVARSALLGFEEIPENGRWSILLAPDLIMVQPYPRRAHQGWRYLEAKDAPADIGPVGGDDAGLPPSLVQELGDLGLF